MPAHFTELDREDLKEIFRIHDFSKVDKVDDTVARAERAGQTPAELFDDLYQLFKIEKLPQREMVAKRLRLTVATATDADVESAIRQAEMKGFTERDAVRLLERKFSAPHLYSGVLVPSCNGHSSALDGSLEESELVRKRSSLRHIKGSEASLPSEALPAESVAASEGGSLSSMVFAQPPNKLTAAPTRENLDEVMEEEVREWLGKILGDKFSPNVLSTPNFIDALRSGVLLHVLLQKMESPPVADEDLRLPKRTTGFFIRDNVATFLTEAKTRYQLVDAQLFTVSDLVDGKNDRQVVTCLMSMARIAYSASTIKVAPSIIVYEHEIEQQQNRLTATDLDRIVQEAEADENCVSRIASPDASAELPSSTTAPMSVTASSTVHACGESRHLDPPRAEESPDLGESASTQRGLASAAVAADEAERRVAPDTATVSDRDALSDGIGDEGVSAASQAAPPSEGALLSVSPPPSVAEGAVDISNEHAAEPSVTSALTDAGEHSLSKSVSERRASPSSAQRSPTQRDEAPAEAEHGTAVAQETETTEDMTKAQGTSTSDAAPLDDSDNEGSASGSCVFYLRDGRILSAKPTEGEAHVFAERRKQTGPRVVWKHPTSPLAATKPPRYHSRHWDGIDIALGRHLNEHYRKHDQSPWRFRTVTATAGEYVLYNRLNASRRVVFLRIIQAKLFLRNAGKHQRWIEIDEALEGLEKSET
ncbi:hypothetical protein LSCM1_00524 [Leishmania martiniquensis]|uniref:Calponin-homology (CH) domain-containing protein n=1 Tax=Leishmania martiniquensis TaxID=1580590 RepID=A0A836GC22_9TRYP|nr:hypothetical protein LSCM1_00524 [Leishmania martiniquensis]